MTVQKNQTFEHNSWLDGVDPLPPFPKVDEDMSADWLIVGAGFTGVSAARQIAKAKPQDRILLIDAGSILDGSSSRSSGFVVPIGHFYRPQSTDNKKLYRLGSEGVDLLRKLVSEYEIQCGWDDSGRLIGARGVPGLKSLKKIRQSLEFLNSPCVSYTSEQIRQRTGMMTYQAAIRQTESVMVNPALLLRALIRSLPTNVIILENSPVTAIGANGNVDLKCGARIESSKTILSINAYTNELGIGRNRVFPMRTYVSAVEFPASGDQDSAWGITSSERVGSSIRRVGNRLFIRSTAVHGLRSHDHETELRKIADYQLCVLRSRLDDAVDDNALRLRNTWSGPISITANGAPVFGQMADNVFYSTGYNGHGIAHGSISGRLMADLAMGLDSELLAIATSMRKPNWIPSGSILKAGVSAYVGLLKWRYGAEV